MELPANNGLEHSVNFNLFNSYLSINFEEDKMFSNNKTASASDIFLQKAQYLDLSSIASVLMESEVDPRWSQTQAIEASAQYLAFLYLVDRYPHLQLIPDSNIAQVWHYHLLDAEKYTEDCQMLFGYRIDCFPYLDLRSTQSDCNHLKAYALTQVLLAKLFSGALPNQTPVIEDCESTCPTAKLNGRKYWFSELVIST